MTVRTLFRPDLPFLRDPALISVLDAIEIDGDSARIVGGAVRNALLGLPVSDLDLTTTALPPAVIARAAAAGLRSVPTGIDHGTVTVIAQGTPFEVTTLRTDVETDGRRAIVAFGTSYEEDAERRDFTINALSVNRRGQIFDTVGGLDDLAARRVRFIGDAARRIAEDRLRVLRFLRFSAQYGVGPLDPAGVSAAVAARDGLAALSAERVRAETLKLLTAPRAAEILGCAAEAGLMERIFGGIVRANRLAQVLAIAGMHGWQAGPVLRLVAAGVFVAEDVERLRNLLRLTNAERAEALALVAAREALGCAGFDAASLRALHFRFGDSLREALLLAAADSDEAERQTFVSLRQGLPDSPPRFLLSGADVMTCGIAPGPAVGAVLGAAQTAWIEAGLPEDRARQIALLARVLAG